MTAKGYSAGDILQEINTKLRTILPVGMFFGAQLVVVNHDLEHVRVFNAGMPDLLIVDGSNHRIKHRLPSTGLPLGVEADNDAQQMLQYAPISPNDKILMYSDGLIEARNGEEQPFGNERLVAAIATAPPDGIFDHLFAELDVFCGNRVQSDDVTLVEITCVHDLLPAHTPPDSLKSGTNQQQRRGDWTLTLRFDGSRLRETNPVPVLVNYLVEMESLENERQALFTVITELYVNALDHGVLALDSSMKKDQEGFESYFQIREQRLDRLDSGYVIFDLSAEQHGDQRSLLLRVEDSGAGFDFKAAQQSPTEAHPLSGRGLVLVRDLCESLDFHGQGNIALVRFNWKAA